MRNFTGEAGHETLDKYDTVRLDKYRTVINPISSENFEKLWKQAPIRSLRPVSSCNRVSKPSEDKELSANFAAGMFPKCLTLVSDSDKISA